jgi:acetyl esterase/lipase
VTRQLAAFLASGDRRALLATIQAPTLVLHGADDPLIPVACGYDVAAHIPGAKMRVIEGMAHDFPAGAHRGVCRCDRQRGTSCSHTDRSPRMLTFSSAAALSGL